MDRVLTSLKRIARDDSGQVMAEYIIASLPGFIIAAFLYYPGNDLYAWLRCRYDIAYWLLTLPGP